MEEVAGIGEDDADCRKSGGQFSLERRRRSRKRVDRWECGGGTLEEEEEGIRRLGNADPSIGHM